METISPSPIHSTRNMPSRSQSTRVPASSSTPHRSSSVTTHRPSERPLDSIAKRDAETTNLARPRRSSTSKDRNLPDRSESTRNTHHKSSSRTRESRHQQEMSGNTSVAQGSGPAPVVAPPESKHGAGKSGRTRTTIQTQTGNWVLGKTIGAGSMGKVKLAKRVEGGEQVAVKIVPRLSTEDQNQSRADRERADHSKEIRTAREAAIVTLLDHPYICGMVDVKRTSYHWYMLFEYVNGGQMLDYIISHGRLKEKQARKFSRQIASALDYCHRNSIVHRDLKIENILISKTGDIKIIDFGLSNLFSPKSHLKTFCGSLYFAAPELLQAKAYTGPEVDVWSFGIVLYVLVCGKVPFDDQSMPALHAKIKKGLVDYPSWLTVECKSLISRMLVTDPKQRASLQEIMQHPWMVKNHGGAPENHLPAREPLQLPLDPEVIHAMTGFDFGSAELIHSQLTKVVESEDYQRAVRLAANQKEAQTPTNTEKKRGFGFDFYKRRNSISSRETLAVPSSEALQLGVDPINAFNPLVSVYYLVREKQERDRVAANPGATSMPRTPGEAPLQLHPDVVEPQAAYTNAATYEMAGEKPTGGRSRPRARTHGEDDVTDSLKNIRLGGVSVPASPALIKPPVDSPTVKKESTAAGILRRFSTRRRRDPDRSERPPLVTVQSPAELATVPRKSFSVRRTRESDREHPPSSMQRSGSIQPQQSDHLSPRTGESSTGKPLGRSSSVSSIKYRRPDRRGGSDAPPRSHREAPATSGSDRSNNTNASNAPLADKAAGEEENATLSPRTAKMRASKSLGHARRESIQARRARREEAREANVPEETDVEAGEQSGVSTERVDSAQNVKPVFLKGLFSVSTTSTKPVPAIRSDIIRVLKQVGVEYTEIRGGFSCKHIPSIDLKKVVDNTPQSPGPPSSGHRRRISFGGLMGGGGGGDRDRERDRDEFREAVHSPNTPKTPRRAPDASYTNSDVSEESFGRDQNSSRRAVGETSTHVQSDLGGSMILHFEIVIVKIPLLSLHGIQFKRLAGGTWQYKSMADKILRELRL